MTARSDQGQPGAPEGRPERRRSPRFQVDVPARLVAPSGSFDGRLRDICRDAAWLECGSQCEVGTVVAMTMELPGTGGPIELTGKVIRVGPGEHDPHGMAVLFTEVPPSAATRIDFFVALQGY